jgi:hypothetical protein
VLRVGYAEGDIVKMQRLSRRLETGKARPLMITLSEARTKNVIMGVCAEATSRKGSNVKAVTISHDMTVREKDVCRQLVAQAKQKTEGQMTSGIHLQNAWHHRPNKYYQNQKKLFEHHKDMFVLSTNSHSLLNNSEKLELLICSLEEKLHIIAITEVRSKIHTYTVTRTPLNSH